MDRKQTLSISAIVEADSGYWLHWGKQFRVICNNSIYGSMYSGERKEVVYESKHSRFMIEIAHSNALTILKNVKNN